MRDIKLNATAVCLLLVIMLQAAAHATTYNISTGNVTVSSIGSGPTDTVNISGSAVVTVNTNGPQLRAHVWNQSGGTLSYTGAGHNRLSVYGFNGTGGNIQGRAGDTLSTVNRWTGGAGNPVMNSNMDIVGAMDTNFVFFCDSASAAGRSKMITTSTTNTMRLRNYEVQSYQGGWPSGGWTISANRNFTNVRLVRGLYDSSSASIQNVTGGCLLWPTFKTYGNDNRAVIFQGGGNDSLIGARIIHNNRGQSGNAGAQGVYVWSNNAVIYGCNIKDSNYTGSWGGDYGIALEQNVGGTRILFDTVSGFEFTVASPAGNHPNVFIYGSKIQHGGHESVIIHPGDINWKIQNSLITSFSGGGRSAFTAYCNSSGTADGLELLYNTIISCYGGAPASAAIAFENTGAGNIIYNNIKMVGNLLVGDNTGFNRAEIILGTTPTQTVTVNFTEFKDNAFDSVYYHGTSSATYPYSRLDSNLHNATSFIFVDSLGGDFRLGVGSTMKNAADSAYGCRVYGNFRAITQPFNIGFDQNFYNRWLYSKHPWIKTVAITYGVSDSVAGDFIGRKYDLVINPSNTAYGSRSGVLDAIRRRDSMTKCITYGTYTSLRDEDVNATGYLTRFLQQFPAYPRDSFYLWSTSTGGTFTLNGQQSSCGSQFNTIGNTDTFRVCGWTEANRKVIDFRNQNIGQFQAFKALSGISTEGAAFDGTFGDEWSTLLAPVNNFNNPTGSTYGMMYPFSSADYNPTTSYLRARPWSSYTYVQIRDSLIKLKQNRWLKRFTDSLNIHQFRVFGNTTDYDILNYPSSSTTNVGEVWFDAQKTGVGLTFFENGNSPYIYGNAVRGDKTRNAWLWQAMDSIKVWDTGQIICWHAIMPVESLTVAGLGGWGRLQLERYVFHQMAASTRSWFLLSSNMPGPLLKPNDYVAGDTLYKWVKAADRDIGMPTGARFVAATGTDGAGQAYTIYRRNFERGILVYRAASGLPGNVGASSAVNYALGTTGTPVNPDNTLGTPTTTASIRNMEGLIFQTTATIDTAIFVTAAFGNEGDSIGVIVQGIPTIGVDRIYRFSTSDVTAIGFVNYTPIHLEAFILTAGNSADTVWIHTIRDFVDTPDLVGLSTITNVSVGFISTSTANWKMYDIDQPPQEPVIPGGFLQGWRK